MHPTANQNRFATLKKPNVILLRGISRQNIHKPIRDRTPNENALGEQNKTKQNRTGRRTTNRSDLRAATKIITRITRFARAVAVEFGGRVCVSRAARIVLVLCVAKE
mmetsp:Transcript_3155/g.6943  ORF Transcript_3155/g.6943 Transcript_3155/m.6943 type:complete len:107 (-) Transcript_3155:27-347(-)